MADQKEVPEPPQKRPKLSDEVLDQAHLEERVNGTSADAEHAKEIASSQWPIGAPAPLQQIPKLQYMKEAEVGITEFVNPRSIGFAGVLKKR